MEIGVPELLIVLLIAVFLFGPGRIARLGGEVGRGLRDFRQGLRGDEEEGSAAPEGVAPTGGAARAQDAAQGVTHESRS